MKIRFVMGFVYQEFSFDHIKLECFFTHPNGFGYRSLEFRGNNGARHRHLEIISI